MKPTLTSQIGIDLGISSRAQDALRSAGAANVDPVVVHREADIPSVIWVARPGKPASNGAGKDGAAQADSASDGCILLP